MSLTKEPSVALKIRKMKERVRWQQRQIKQRKIDQTRLAFADEYPQTEEFSFLVLGDSGTGRHRKDSPQRQVAKYLMEQGKNARFVLHTGDVVYLVGSSEQYYDNFIKPYREFLVGGEKPKEISYNQMVFKLPFLPVLGNHDYYDISPLLGVLSGLASPLRYVFRRYIDLDVGWHGSFQGNAYACAFMDYLKNISEFKLGKHLDNYYTTQTDTGRCLTYQPTKFTRIPNRYYTFRYGGIDFFALDSNTFNQPQPLSQDPEDLLLRKSLEIKKQELINQKNELLKAIMGFNEQEEAQGESIEQITSDLEEIDEQINDINKQLSATQNEVVDHEQLDWLTTRLIASWQDKAVRGRILFFHHPPYVTEASKWSNGQTLAVRKNLRKVLDEVAAKVGTLGTKKPLVDLVLCGHAHCLEYLRTEDTSHGDADLNWFICGGSGYSLRRQRVEGSEITEKIDGVERVVVKNHLFVGRTGKGSSLKRPYSALRIDVKKGTPPQLVITPVVAEKYQGKWSHYCLESIVI